MNPQPQSVLIVDPMEETRAVLRTALAQRGLQIWEASRVRQGADLAREHHPDLIVFDLENSGDSNRPLDSEWLTSSDDSTPAVVFLGTARLNEPKPRGGEFVQKPYHYGPLIRKIEELLAKCRETA